MRKIRRYLILLRPFTLLAPLIVSISVMAASYVYTTTQALPLFSLIWTMIPASLSLAFLNGASNALNQASDYREDCLSKPYRLLPRKLITQREAYAVAILVYTIAIGCAALVNPFFFAFICIIALFTITYSLPPRMKRILAVNQLWVALPRGLFGILASWSVFADPFQSIPLAIGAIASTFLFGGTATKDVLDAAADRTVGTDTLCNVLGVRKTAVISAVIMIGSFAAIIPLVVFGILPPGFIVLAGLMLCGVLIAVLLARDCQNRSYENTRAWLAMYLTYFLFTVSFACITIVSSVATQVS
jgi:4-hydroxybenzoate polyprenyltransferase